MTHSPPTRRPSDLSPARQSTKAIVPRQRTERSSTALPSTLARPPSPAITSSPRAARASRQASHPPCASAESASGHAAIRGISDTSTANAAASASASSTATSSGEARRSSLQPDASTGGRQGADALDERVECGIGGVLVTKEPAPEPIVFAVQQL